MVWVVLCYGPWDRNVAPLVYFTIENGLPWGCSWWHLFHGLSDQIVGPSVYFTIETNWVSLTEWTDGPPESS